MGQTEDLALAGEQESDQVNLAGEVTAGKPDPLVVERARVYADVLDRIDQQKQKAEAAYADLQDAFKKSKRHRKVTLSTEFNVWTFWSESKYQIKKKREIPVK